MHEALGVGAQRADFEQPFERHADLGRNRAEQSSDIPIASLVVIGHGPLDQSELRRSVVGLGVALRR